MERVETLLQKLQEQFNNGVKAEQLLITVQMLQHELIHIQKSLPQSSRDSVIISMPLQAVEAMSVVGNEPEKQPVVQEKSVEVQKVEEQEVAAELDEMKQNAILIERMTAQNNPPFFSEPENIDIPTLTHQTPIKGKEINESVNEASTSLNDRLMEKKIEISEKLKGAPVKDLKKAIGINDRFLYINDLFRGDEVMYERSIKTINSFSIWPEAEYWIRRELKTKLGWTDDNETVLQFDQLVKRRFS